MQCYLRVYIIMSWRDKSACNVITKTLRMKLLRSIDINYDSCLISELKPYLTQCEIENICNKVNRLSRVKTFLDTITRIMTTEVFLVFVKSLKDTKLESELLEAYVAEW